MLHNGVHEALYQHCVRLGLYTSKQFSSPELKDQISFFDHLMSGVCPSVCLSVKISNSSPYRTSRPILTKLDTKHYRLKGVQVCSNEGPVHISMGHD